MSVPQDCFVFFVSSIENNYLLLNISFLTENLKIERANDVLELADIGLTRRICLQDMSSSSQELDNVYLISRKFIAKDYQETHKHKTVFEVILRATIRY